MHYTTDEKDARQNTGERRFWTCSKGHASSALHELRRCPVTRCRGVLTEDRRGKRKSGT